MKKGSAKCVDHATKQVRKESLEPGQKSSTGGDPVDRYRGQYSKKPPEKDENGLTGGLMGGFIGRY